MYCPHIFIIQYLKSLFNFFFVTFIHNFHFSIIFQQIYSTYYPFDPCILFTADEYVNATTIYCLCILKISLINRINEVRIIRMWLPFESFNYNFMILY